MEIKNTIKISAPITPYDTDDVQPTHLAEYGKGGYRTIQTMLERDLIPDARREIGMLVYVKETNKLYSLKNGIDNSNWVTFESVLKGDEDFELYITPIEPGGSIKPKSAWLNTNIGVLYYRDSTNSFWKPTNITDIDGGNF